MNTFTFEAPASYQLARTFSVYRMGSYDPSLQIERGLLRVALQTPEGATTAEVCHREGQLDVSLWGDGSSWVEPRLPAFLGLLDDPSQFDPPRGPMRRIWKRSLGTHLPTLPVVFTRLTQVILLQLVTTAEAFRAWRRIVQAFGTPAPGPGSLTTPPSPAALGQVPWHRFVADGVPHRQARTLARAARSARSVEEAAAQGSEALRAQLERIRGIGPWTQEYVAGTALGDADAVLVGDYNLPHTTAFLLAGRERGTDEEMLALLEPYRGHRFRVIRAIWSFGVRAPRRGPRRAPRPLWNQP